MVGTQPRIRQQYRNQSTVLVGTSDTLLVGSNPRRIALAVSSATASAPLTPFSQIAHNLSGAATGVIQSFTVPAGQSGVLTNASIFQTNLAPTVALQLVRGGTTITIASSNTNQDLSPNTPLQAGDTVQWNVTAAVAASTVDAMLAGTLSSNSGPNSITLSFIGPAVVNNGLILNPGTLPFILKDEHIGQAIREEIRSIAAQSAVTVGVLDIFEGDCPCGVDSGMGYR